jgi:hypothetical protein
MRCPLPDDRAAVPTGSNAERSMPDARRTIDGGAEGNKNNFRHGRYSAEAIAGRRKIRELVRAMRALAATERADAE